MMGRSHLLIAGAAYMALAARPIETPYATLTAPILGGVMEESSVRLLASFVIAAACGLAPDIDKHSSWAARSLGLPTQILSWGIEHSFGHRGGFHSLLALVGAYLLGEAVGRPLGLTGLGALIAFGWGVHLVTDAWTVHGIPLFWPLTVARVRLPPWISTGSFMEYVMLVLSLVALAVYAIGPESLAAVGR